MSDMISKKNETSAKGKKQVRFFSRLKSGLHSDLFRCIMMDIVAFFAILFIFFFVCVPKKYDLSINSIAPETIKATKDVTDEVTTKARKEEEAAKPQYIVYRNVNSLEAAFEEIRAVQLYGESLRTETGIPADTESVPEENGSPESVPPESGSNKREYTESELNLASEFLVILKLSPEQVSDVMDMNPQDMELMISVVSAAVDAELSSAGLKDEKSIRDDSSGKIDKSIDRLLNNNDLSAYQFILPQLLECIKPNYVIDQEKTDEERRKAMDSVEPVIYQQGRTIVREGEPITDEYQLALLRSLGLLNDQSVNYSVYGGSALAVLIAMLCLLMSLKLLHPDILTDVRRMAVVLIVLILSVIMAAVAHLLPSQYVIPLTMGAILGTVLLGYRAGICLSFALSLLFGSLTSGNASSTFFDVVLLMSMTIAESILSILFLKDHPQRVRVLLSGLISSVISFVILTGSKWLTSSETLDILTIGGWSFAGGILSGVLAAAFQPALEQVFRLATPSRLLELTNPNQPLMRRLMIEAPGTYHHSIIVANLAEAAADKIQANPYLARAGAYYHDIGKLKRPGYFKENQNADNPHERIDPYVSAAILISHTMDGVLLAQKERMPREIQDIILQHHGVTPVMFFYHKALQMSNGSNVDIDEFRYSGPKPKTKEAAIVMLADTIEAAVRSMKDPTPKGIDQFIERLVRGKLEDGQLSDSPLSLSDIDQICEAFSGILKGVYHERIEYPSVPHYAGKTVPVPEAAENAQDAAKPEESATAGPAVRSEPAAPDGAGPADPESAPSKEDSSDED